MPYGPEVVCVLAREHGPQPQQELIAAGVVPTGGLVSTNFMREGQQHMDVQACQIEVRHT